MGFEAACPWDALPAVSWHVLHSRGFIVHSRLPWRLVKVHVRARFTISHCRWQLTVDLLATYKRINMIYYEKKKYNDGYDDKNGDYILHAGDVLVR